MNNINCLNLYNVILDVSKKYLYKVLKVFGIFVVLIKINICVRKEY